MADANVNKVSMTEKQKVKEITDRLEEGLKELFESEKYKSYLSTMSKFHNYSANNIQLIAMQRPDATFVAGYKAWQNNFERHVNKGEKGIRILAPAPYKIKEEQEKIDPVTKEPMLDEDGMPVVEEVEIKIPAFRVVTVFDYAQTDGKELPGLDVNELHGNVENYQDFMEALKRVSPVPISYEEMEGDRKGYFLDLNHPIGIKEGMSEAQTAKTGVHEVAHAKLHAKETGQDAERAAYKDRETMEVEAESVAYTVCQHFGIDTSDYSFGYIAGWSSGKEMPELKSSLDTIRKTSSELIKGIETQLLEIEKEKAAEQAQEDIILLVANSDRSEYELLSVRGMDRNELLISLSAMKDDDRQSVEAYLERAGAWTTLLGNERSEEVEEYHLDYAYNTDTHEITDFKALEEENAINGIERANKPIEYADIVVRISTPDSGGYETIKITNMQPEVQNALYDLPFVEDNEWNGSVTDYLAEKGFEFVPIMRSGGVNDGYPQFYDFDVDMTEKEIHDASELPAMLQAEQLINRMEFHRSVYDSDERNMIMNHAYKLDDMEKTTSLAHSIAEQKDDLELLSETKDMAQAEIDFLPDGMVGLSEMHEYGYSWNEMLPLTKERAEELFREDVAVYRLHSDSSESLVEDKEALQAHDGLFGVQKDDWNAYLEYQSMKQELAESAPNREVQLLYGSESRFGIYQLKDTEATRDIRFMAMDYLEMKGVSVSKGNYELVYTGELVEGMSLEDIYTKFNIDHPADFTGHSLSVSDVVVLHQDGQNTSHYVDAMGYREVPEFTKEITVSAEVSEEKVPVMGEDAKSAEENVHKEVGTDKVKIQREMTPEEVKDFVKKQFEYQLKNSGIDDVSLYMERFDALYEQGKMEHLMPTEEQRRVLADIASDEQGNAHTNMEKEETELAFQLADRYISIQEVSGGYDYTIYDMNYRELDGGVYDNPSLTIRQALDEIVTELKEPMHRSELEGNIHTYDELIPVDYGELIEKAEQEAKYGIERRMQKEAADRKAVEDFKAKTGELFRGINGQTQEDIELSVYAYLQSKIDEYGINIKLVDMAVSGSRCRGLEKAGSDLDVVVEYKGRETEDDLFNAFNEDGFMIGGIKVDINPITEGKTGTLGEYLPGVETYLEGVREAREKEPRSIFSIRMNDEERFFENTSSLDADALCRAYGECGKPFVEMGQYGRWIDIGEYAAIQQSDRLAFSVEFNDETDEITIFDGENFEYKGLRETVYPDQEEKNVRITLTVAECGEFHNFGEYHEDIAGVEEAAAIFNSIPPERRNAVPSIGINIHTEGTESYEDAQMDIVSGSVIDLEMLEYYPEITGNQKALEVISELISQFPDAEVRGSLDKWLSVEMQRSEPEPDADKAALLAVEIDQISYDYDTVQYRDTVDDRDAQVANIAEDIRNGNTEYLNDFLNAIISDSIREGITDIFGKGAELDGSEGVQTARKAKELLDSLAEYKLPAKAEENADRPEESAVQLTELQQKAAEIAKGYEKLPMQDRINIIAQSFGCMSGRIETSPCTGKWRGTSDISIRFDNGTSLFIGNNRTPQAKTAKVQNECVSGALVRYNPEIIRITKETATSALRKREAKDNETAAQKGLKPYTLLNVEFNDGKDEKSGGHMGWYYVTLAVDGEIRPHIETGLNYDILDGKVSEAPTRENYYVAGALKESDVDYVFNNVGFSSTSGLYSLPVSEEVRERAEKTLEERGMAQAQEQLTPDGLMTGERITTPRGSFHVTAMSREQMEAAGYGFHHQSDNGKYLIMGNGKRAFAVAAEPPENYLKAAKQNADKTDNVLNSEKPKEEKQPGRISVKEKLAEKKAVIEQRDKAEREVPEKGTEKKSEREI